MNPEYIDRNYGGVFIFWDRLFGTFCEEKQEPRYGLVSQLKTYDPVTAELHVFRDLFGDLWKTKYKWQGIRSFFLILQFGLMTCNRFLIVVSEIQKFG